MAIFTDVFEDVTKQGRKLQTSQYKEQGKYAIIDQGQAEIAGYTDETEGVFTDVPAIAFGDHTRVVKYVDVPCFLGADGVKLLKAKVKRPNYKYLFYALSHADIPNTGYNRHFKWLKEVNIRLPDEQEQCTAVEILDQVTNIISLRKQQLAKLDELVKARFVEMFDGADRTPMSIREACRVIADGDWIEAKDQAESGIRLVQTGNVGEGEYLPKDDHAHYISEETFARLNCTEIYPGDILISRLPNPVGRACIIPNIGSKMITAVDCTIVRVNTEIITNDFFIAFTSSAKYMSAIAAHSRGATRTRVSRKNLESIIMEVPPLELQKRFAAFVESTDKSKFEIQKSLDKLETLKKALMQKYFG